MIQVKINNDKTFDLCYWNEQRFQMTQELCLDTTDLQSVQSVFADIQTLDIYEEGRVVATYTSYNTYGDIVFLRAYYSENKKKMVGALKVSLTKKDLIRQVEDLSNKVNNVVDIESMTVDEYRDYVLQNISNDCQQDIFDGQDIEISTGTGRFTFTMQDQQNLFVSMNVLDKCKGVVDASSIMIPYHMSSNPCALYSPYDICTIFLTLQMRLVDKTTYCNMLNCYVRTLQTKEELGSVNYGIVLPDEYLTKYNVIMEANTKVIDAIKKSYAWTIPVDTTTPSVDGNTDTTVSGGTNEEVV